MHDILLIDTFILEAHFHIRIKTDKMSMLSAKRIKHEKELMYVSFPVILKFLHQYHGVIKYVKK